MNRTFCKICVLWKLSSFLSFCTFSNNCYSCSTYICTVCNRLNFVIYIFFELFCSILYNQFWNNCFSCVSIRCFFCRNSPSTCLWFADFRITVYSCRLCSNIISACINTPEIFICNCNLSALFTYNIYYFTIIQLRWLLIGGIIFDDYINRCILYETKKEIVAFRLERFYTINYKSILDFKGLKMWRKMYQEGKQNIGI